MFFGSTAASPARILGRPALPLKVHDVGLHEDRAAVSEDRHRLRGERPIGVVVDWNTESVGGRLEKIPVSSRALRIQPKVFDPAILQDD
jgi:hypothetical protein